MLIAQPAPPAGDRLALVNANVVNVATGAVLVLRAAGRGAVTSTFRNATAGIAAIVGAAIVFALVAPGWIVDPAVARIRAVGAPIYESREDEIASVQAGKLATPQLWVTGTGMTLLTVDAKLMPILPLMVRPDAKTALTVAFGMGSAFRGAVIAGLKTEAVELVPSVPDMFHYFYPDAPQILANPNAKVIVTDGRNHLELTTERYDIIVTDPPPPIFSSGASVISSLEYYQAGHDHLTPGGVMMQWIPWGSSIDEFRAHVRTFKSVFAHASILFGSGGYGLYMLGSDEPMTFDEGTMRAVLARPGVLEDISSAYDAQENTIDGWIRRIGLMRWIDDAQIDAFTGAGPLITDDRPLPEYFFLRRLFDPGVPLASPQLLYSLTR
jgi:hypothetical protein